ncbi:MAG TPA: hypothetical protein VHC44_05615 [Verrucomicrobiae bacterium]|nr:hypothetical protein [Verrucomicrobiae bacterium]
MTKKQWNNWYSQVYAGLSEIERLSLDYSEHLREAVEKEDYFLAEQIVMEMFPDSAWLM